MSPSPRDLNPDDLQKVLATVDIPACPTFVTEAMNEAQKDEPDIRRLAAIITNDPGMSAAAVKLANSPIYGGGSSVSGVRQAIDRLGTRNIVCVVVASALRNSIGGLPAAWLDSFWKRAGQLAVAASLIARRVYGVSPDAAYTYALFHDAAIPLMMKRFPDYGKVLERCVQDGTPIVQAENDYFPCTHPIVGSLLVRNWGLPAILGQAIRFHHELDAYDLPDRTLPGGALAFIAVTQVAEHLLAEIQEGEDIEVGHELFARALDYLGLSVDDVDDLRQRVSGALGEAAYA
ncbi:MAG: HDOD domain-containing protein [Azonexaceae bacterium]|nr:HDOD domain-containing protein [Azonexaceae bacterium]